MQTNSQLRMALIYLCAIALQEGLAHAADVTWDGGGTDHDWSTQENWSDDTVPGSSNNAFFDDTSTKDCDVTDLQSVASLTARAATRAPFPCSPPGPSR